MAKILPVDKSAAVNPLKSSQPLGAAFAYLGVDGAVPLFHGSQGCTSFALVLFVRHFKETIPLQTTAMDEVATIMGGADHLEEAILNLKNRTKPKLIGICTTALVETRGEDFAGDLVAIKARRAEALEGTEVVLANTPDFSGSIEEGWSKAVLSMIEGIVDRTEMGADDTKIGRHGTKIAILPSWNLTVADIEDIRDMVEAFGLEPIILPDVSGALDGTVPGKWIPTTYGGTKVEDIKRLGECVHCLAIGESMRTSAEALEVVAGVPFTVFETLTGLRPADRFVTALAELSGNPVPASIRRRRSQLSDALLDGHFHFGGKKIALAAEPDHLFQLSTFFVGMGAEVSCAVTTTGGSSILRKIPADTVRVGDLGDFERLAVGADLLVTHSHGRQAAEHLELPLMRVGFPIFDRLGMQHKSHVLYRGTRDLIFEVSNIFQAHHREPTPEGLDPLRNRENDHDSRSSIDARAH